MTDGPDGNNRLTVDQLARRVREQADRLFPNRTDTSMYLKMFQELGEMVESGDPDEVADVFIMMLDFAERKGINVQDVVERKMSINETRRWAMNELGVMKHVE